MLGNSAVLRQPCMHYAGRLALIRMEAKDASTIILVRDTQKNELEVLMLERNTKSGYVPGAHLFPGGGVDETDKSSEYLDICTGITDKALNHRDKAFNNAVDTDDHTLAWKVAAIRECFEEVGILLATPLPGNSKRLAKYRTQVAEDPKQLIDICKAENIRLTADKLHYFSHWITPHGAPRRYDTRFFLTIAPENQSPVEDGTEIVKTLWITPKKALEAYREGSFDMLLPTVKTLETIGEFKDVESLIKWAGNLDTIPSIQPRVRMHNDELQVLIPGDDGYDETDEYPPEGLRMVPGRDNKDRQ